jgi:hypothetical protein
MLPVFFLRSTLPAFAAGGEVLTMLKGDRAFKLGSGPTSGYARYIKFPAACAFSIFVQGEIVQVFLLAVNARPLTIQPTES